MTHTSILAALSKLLEMKLALKPSDRDLVVMVNEFLIRTIEGKLVKRKLNLMLTGFQNGLPYQATSFLVGTPSGIVVQMILDGKIKDRGLMAPSSNEVVETVLEELERMGIRYQEEFTVRAKF